MYLAIEVFQYLAIDLSSESVHVFHNLYLISSHFFQAFVIMALALLLFDSNMTHLGRNIMDTSPKRRNSKPLQTPDPKTLIALSFSSSLLSRHHIYLSGLCWASECHFRYSLVKCHIQFISEARRISRVMLIAQLFSILVYVAAMHLLPQ